MSVSIGRIVILTCGASKLVEVEIDMARRHQIVFLGRQIMRIWFESPLTCSNF